MNTQRNFPSKAGSDEAVNHRKNSGCWFFKCINEWQLRPNRVGPKTESCGTPHFIYRYTLYELLTSTIKQGLPNPSPGLHTKFLRHHLTRFCCIISERVSSLPSWNNTNTG